MRYKKLDMNLLAALDVLLRTKSVSQAADELFITQSAMSNALGRLRSFFSDPLLVQVGRQMELSPLAQSLSDPLRDIIMRIDGSIIVSPSFAPIESDREFTIVLSDYSLTVLGGELSRRIMEDAPGVRLNLRPQMASPEKLLERGDIDLLVVPASIAVDNHTREHLFEDKLVVLASADYPGPDIMDRQSFIDAPMVVMEPFFGQDSFAVLAMRAAGIEPRKAISTYAFSSMANLLKGTNRIALIQERLARLAMAEGGFRIMAPPIAVPPLEQTLRWHRHRSRDPGLIWLRKLVKECAAVERLHS
ncbi:LysR family transcriptional regulator [Allorhizobium terrae]|nr:LysR family transcriptional regulator [Allorhizobium terrae]